MAPREVEFLLIGGGVASAHCAARLRERGAEGDVLLVGREPDPPYDRPPLSKDYLIGGAERADALVREEGWYEEHGIELRTRTNVMGLDVGERTAKLQGGEEVRFSKALIATGAMVRILRLEGAQLDGIHYLRAFGNADAIRADAKEAERIVLIGGSYIGCEVAASMAAQGKQCAIVMMEEVTLERGFGPEAGRWVQERLEERGVDLLAGEEVESLRGEDRVQAVVTKSGRDVEGDLVVVGAGVRPDVMLAQRAGLDVEDGIVCDQRLQTSAEGIFAAGDCCSYESVLHGERMRIEHWDVALQQGRHVADAMLGEERPYDVVPYFFSDLADWASLHSVGTPRKWDETLWRGDRAGDEWSLWYLRDGRVEAALTCGRQMDLIDARRLIADGVDVSEHRAELSDVGTDLGEIA